MLAFPLMKTLVNAWDPLPQSQPIAGQQPAAAPVQQQLRESLVLKVLARWQMLLSGEMVMFSTQRGIYGSCQVQTDEGARGDVYGKLIQDLLLPKLRMSIRSERMCLSLFIWAPCVIDESSFLWQSMPVVSCSVLLKQFFVPLSHPDGWGGFVCGVIRH